MNELTDLITALNATVSDGNGPMVLALLVGLILLVAVSKYLLGRMLRILREMIKNDGPGGGDSGHNQPPKLPMKKNTTEDVSIRAEVSAGTKQSSVDKEKAAL